MSTKQKDMQKLEFVMKALDGPDPFERECTVSPDIVAAEQWKAARSDAEITQYWESIVSGLEAANNQFWQDGTCQKWLAGAEPDLKKASLHVVCSHCLNANDGRHTG